MEQYFIKNQNNLLSVVASKKQQLTYDSYTNKSIIFQVELIYLVEWKGSIF